MRNLKRAYLGVTKRTKKSALTLLIIVTVVTMMTIGLAIQNTVEQATEKTKSQMKSEITITKDWANTDATDFEKIPNINRKVLEQINKVKGVNTTHVVTDTFVRTNNKSVKYEDGEMMKTIFNKLKYSPTNNLYGLDNKNDIDAFKSGDTKLIEGKMPIESNEKKALIISNSYAKLNKLKVGDKITLFAGEMYGKQKVKYTISGIYENITEVVRGPLDVDNTSNPENNFYTTVKNTEETATLDTPNVPLIYNKAKITVENIDELPKVIERIKKEVPIEWKYMAFESDYEQYLDATKSINKVASISKIILWISGISGVAILSLIMILSLRDRKYEIGVLLSVGERKIGIIVQIMSEILVIFMLSFVLALSISTISANKVGEALISSEVQKEQQVEKQQELNESDNKALIQGKENKNEEIKKINKLNVDVTSFKVIITSLLIGLIIVIVATLLPLLTMLRKDPKTIMLKK